MALRIVNWNLQWAEPTTARGRELAGRIDGEQAEVVCLTEAPLGFLGSGHSIAADADYGYASKGERRKVQLWSRRPWSDVDVLGDPQLPTGRFIRGTTQSSLGEIVFIGVCVPWRNAHVSTGRRDRRPWQDHATYLLGLRSALASIHARRLVVVGDFNQRIPPGKGTPSAVAHLLSAATAGLQLARDKNFGSHREAIDHVFHSSDLCCEELRLLDKQGLVGTKLSDHVGWSLRLATHP